MGISTLRAATLVAVVFVALAAPPAGAVCVDDPARDRIAAAYDAWLAALVNETAELDPNMWKARAAETLAAKENLERELDYSARDVAAVAEPQVHVTRTHAALDALCRPKTG